MTVADISKFKRPANVWKLVKTAKFPCVISLEWLDGEDPLLALVIHPLEGWTHFVYKHQLSALIKAVGHYHVSIAFRSDLYTNEDWRIESDQKIATISTILDGWCGVIEPDDIRNASFIVLDNFFEQLCPEVAELHSWGRYRNRELHISA